MTKTAATLVLAGLWVGMQAQRANAASPPERRDHALVLLALPAPLQIARIVDLYEKTWAPKRRPEVLPGANDDGARLNLQGATASISLVRKPLPAQQLSAAARVSWRWPEAAEVLRGHQAYVDVTLTSHGADAIDHCLALTRLVESVLAATDGEGVYWGNSVVLIEPQNYHSLAASAKRDQLPMKIWVNFLPASLPDRTPVVHTIGLSALSFREMILIDRPGAELDAPNILYGVSEQVIRKQVQLRTADRLKISSTESLLAEAVAAPWDANETVILLRFDSAELRH